jgi:hypothetical protein
MKAKSQELVEIDVKVLGVVRIGISKAKDICETTGLEHRVVDRALQRLRKEGTLAFVHGKGWLPVKKTRAKAVKK